MYTQCPDCLTIYLIAPEALAQARGGLGPAGGIKPQGDVLWLVDELAAGKEDQGYGF